MKTIGNILLFVGAITAVPVLVMLMGAPREMWAVSMFFGLQAIVAGVSVKHHPAPRTTLLVMAVATVPALWQAYLGNVFLAAGIMAVQAPLVWLVQRRARTQPA